MVDIQTISIVIASASVVAGVIYYALQLRHQTKQRQTDLLMRLHLASSTREFMEAALKVRTSNYKDYDAFVEKEGSLASGGEAQIAFSLMGQFFEGIGVLLKNKLADIDLVAQLFGVEGYWMKMKPLVEDLRKRVNNPQLYEWFEYLYNEVKKRKQKLQQEGVKNG
jgi:hypothetical protein